MELKLSQEKDYALATVVGRIDDSAEELFKERLHPLVGQRGTKVVLDLSQSTFITSRGIGDLVSLVVHANASGSRVVIAASPPFIAIVFERAKLHRFFEMAATTAEAINLLSG